MLLMWGVYYASVVMVMVRFRLRVRVRVRVPSPPVPATYCRCTFPVCMHHIRLTRYFSVFNGTGRGLHSFAPVEMQEFNPVAGASLVASDSALVLALAGGRVASYSTQLPPETPVQCRHVRAFATNEVSGRSAAGASGGAIDGGGREG